MIDRDRADVSAFLNGSAPLTRSSRRAGPLVGLAVGTLLAVAPPLYWYAGRNDHTPVAIVNEETCAPLGEHFADVTHPHRARYEALQAAALRDTSSTLLSGATPPACDEAQRRASYFGLVGVGLLISGISVERLRSSTEKD